MKKRKKTKTRRLPMAELRPRRCEVDGRPATFLRWIEEDRALLKIRRDIPYSAIDLTVDLFHEHDTVAPYCSTDVLHVVHALVEYQDGTVHRVDPERIRFIHKREDGHQ